MLMRKSQPEICGPGLQPEEEHDYRFLRDWNKYTIHNFLSKESCWEIMGIMAYLALNKIQVRFYLINPRDYPGNFYFELDIVFE